MAAYRLTTLGTVPPVSFSFEQVLDTVFPDEFEILNHAHSEFLAVIGVDMLEVLAGEVGTLVTVFHLTFHQQSTAFFQEGTSFISGPATTAIGHPDTFVSNVVDERKIAAA